jgi:AAA+ superfamily predicted ATPase
VAYLLTRLDAFRGVLIGTTNRVRELDEAFFRRFDDYIVMPVPDEPTRAALWRRSLDATGLPAEADLALLAHRFAIPGGPIEGAAWRAAAWAAVDGGPVTMPLLLASLCRELEKSDRSPGDVYVEPHRDAVERILRGGG